MHEMTSRKTSIRNSKVVQAHRMATVDRNKSNLDIWHFFTNSRDDAFLLRTPEAFVIVDRNSPRIGFLCFLVPLHCLSQKLGYLLLVLIVVVFGASAFEEHPPTQLIEYVGVADEPGLGASSLCC